MFTTASRMLYIFWILHQTTTSSRGCVPHLGCISFESYIKPQQVAVQSRSSAVVYLLNPTSNHNSAVYLAFTHRVVYLLNPTSNHNMLRRCEKLRKLYIFWILHQTTTYGIVDSKRTSCISFESYIKPQLLAKSDYEYLRCISFESYIKPQPIEYNILIHNIYQSLLLIRNGGKDIISNAKVLKKLQLNRFADNFFRYFTLINTFGFTPEVIDISILLICYT